VIWYFVTGTDTGVGKTFVSVALLRRARALGRRTFGFKPIETGCPGGTLGEDQRALCEAAGGWQTGPTAGLYRFKDPVAPLVAAVSEGVVVDLELVATTARAGASGADLTIVEGAGGWRVPLGPEADMATLSVKLGAPVLLVARAGLGTINHSLLSIEAIERDGCSLAAVVLSVRPGESLDFAVQNADQIRRRWAGKVLVLGQDEGVLDSLVTPAVD
jgi:dethiobiotin synthetase